jgi:hypothetical protein
MCDMEKVIWNCTASLQYELDPLSYPVRCHMRCSSSLGERTCSPQVIVSTFLQGYLGMCRVNVSCTAGPGGAYASCSCLIFRIPAWYPLGSNLSCQTKVGIGAGMGTTKPGNQLSKVPLMCSLLTAWTVNHALKLDPANFELDITIEPFTKFCCLHPIHSIQCVALFLCFFLY